MYVTDTRNNRIRILNADTGAFLPVGTSTFNSATVINEMTNPFATASQVWDTTLADHIAAGSTGEALDNVSGGSSPATIAAAVWDELASGHTTTGSFGKIIKSIKTLLFG